MKKDVKISIAGLHENGTTEAMDDVEGEDCEMVQSQLKIRDGQVEILKEGGTRTHMVFVKNQDMLTYYSTPFGELEIVIHTDRLEHRKLDNGFHVELEYALEVNAAHMSNCNVRIQVEELEGRV